MNFDFHVTEIVRVIWVENFPYENGFHAFRSFLPENELIYHFTGDATMTFGAREIPVRDGTLRLLPEGEHGRYEMRRRRPGGACVDVFFRADAPLSKEAFALDMADNPRVAELFRRLFSVWVARGEGYAFEAMATLYQIFAEIQRRGYLPAEKFRRIEPAVRWIGEHFREPVSCEDLAARCGISYSYLKALFEEKFGVPPKRYVTQLRIRYACDLLLSGLYSVSRVSELSGYRDLHFFSRQFKAHMGVPPAAFARAARARRE